MTFNKLDLYTVSAGTEIFNFWNPFVTKFDSSSFYSWEQDNTPLYDLEERTDYLWEKLGWATSSVPGLVLSVSSSIPTHLDVSSNVFTTLQGAVDALPEILRFPTLIEVAVSGDIGELNLNNVKCEGNGALEIINRVFSTLEVPTADNAYDITDKGVVGRINSLKVDGGSLYRSVFDTSCLHTGSQTSSLFLSTSAMALVVNKYLDDTHKIGYVNLMLGADTSKLTATADRVYFNTHDVKLALAPYPDNTIDTSGLLYNGNPIADDILYGRQDFTNGADLVGIYTGNFLRKIKVSNCDGPIYIRGFQVNAASGTGPPAPIHDYGIHISNTEGLVVEDCGVARAGVAGLVVDDSFISLRRKFISCRNYDHSSRGVVEDYGILANNSKLSFDQDSYSTSVSSILVVAHQKTGIKLVNSQLTGGTAVSVDQGTTPVTTVQQSEVGIELISSVIDLNGVLDVYNNTTGILARQSSLITDSIIGQCSTKGAVELEESTFQYNKNLSKPVSWPLVDKGINYRITKNFFHANGQHIKATSSKIKPTYADSMPTKHGEFTLLANVGFDGSAALYNLPGVELQNSFCELVHPYFWTNYQETRKTRGRHLGVLNSSTALLRGSVGGSTIFSTADLGVVGTSIHVQGNSNLIVAGPTHISQQDSAVLCEDNSNVSFVPHMKADIKTLATSEWDLHNPANHTSVEVYGRVGCLIANNNSTINIRDLGSWYTNWEAGHSTDEIYLNSDSPKQDALYTSAGSFTFYPYNTANIGNPPEANFRDSSYGNADLLPTSDPSTRVFTSEVGGVGYGGYNWFVRNISSPAFGITHFRRLTKGGVCVKAVNNSTVNVENVNFICGPVNADEVYLDPTQNIAGGCNDIRIWAIAGGSTLNANNLSVSGNYPGDAGYHGPRGIYYTDTTYDCSAAALSAFVDSPYLSGQQFIKNLPPLVNLTTTLAGLAADVSALSGAGFYDDMPLSSLSILDFFGLGCSALSDISGVNSTAEVEYFRAWSKKRFGDSNPYGYGTSSTYQNWGPFRLFLEINPTAKALSYYNADLSSYDNRPFQTLAQGYFLSGGCSSTLSSMQDYYFDLLDTARDASGTALSGFVTSGYFHPKDFCLPNNYNIMLDDSASNTFANAKNASLPILGRPKLVEIYRATTEEGGTTSFATSGHGQGFKTTNIFNLDKGI